MVFNKKQRRGGVGTKAPSVLGLDDPQLLRPIRSEVVERFGITFADVHIQIMVRDDIDAVTGDVGSA